MRWITLVSVLFLATSALAAGPIKICIAQSGGPEAKNWKLQAPIAKRIEGNAAEKQLAIVAPLVASDDEKHARAEAREKSCNFVLLSTLENNGQQLFTTFNPSPTARSTVDLQRPTPTVLSLKYKILSADGHKIGASSVPLQLKDNSTPADYEEAGRKLVDTLADQVITALPK